MVVQPLHSSFTLRPSAQSPHKLQLDYTALSTVGVSNDEEQSTKTSRPEVALSSSTAVKNVKPAPSMETQSTDDTILHVAPTTAVKHSHASEPSQRAFRITFTHGQKRHLLAPPGNNPIPPLISSQSSQSYSPFESIENRQLPCAFQPPMDAQYWKKRCFHWQEICQQNRKRLREMEEDQRQLRRRIAQLEDQVLSCSHHHQQQLQQLQQSRSSFSPSETIPNVPVSPTSHGSKSRTNQRPPTWIVTIPKQVRKCCFYLTDSEGLSDSEDYVDEDVLAGVEQDVEDEDDDDNATDDDDDDDDQVQVVDATATPPKVVRVNEGN